MELAIAGAFHAAESLLEGAVAFAKGITHPTLPLRASFTHITSVPLPRRLHSLSVIKGRAYIFGGESTLSGTMADNAMHVIILPSSGVTQADYTAIPARPADNGGAVPAARKGHAAVVIGDGIYIFGGEGQGDESGRVWVFDTVSNTWSHLDPAEGKPYPAQRAGHAMASSELPGPRDEVTFQEPAPQAPRDPATVVPEPAVRGSWGTVFVVGGRKVGEGGEGGGRLFGDGLAFDVRTRTWSNIPTPPGPEREGAAMVEFGGCLYRFGGRDVEGVVSGGAMERVDVSSVWKHAESGTSALKSGWAWEEVGHLDGQGPSKRSGAGLVGVTTGQGRRYLLVIGGEGSSFLDDIWAFQLPPESTTVASVKDATRSAIRKDTKEAKWTEVEYHYLDDAGDEEKEVPGAPRMKGMGARGGFAVAKGTEVDGASVVVWGGFDGNGEVLEDGWLITVDR
ncbi:galactose oxidase [Lepidopterella palustris CBS 459.81]|uniref:Galactose oxidase n=1 Tax=Lepidopterella palustris CBS 459.81 TaxID=1314670 RepID=A0A8E2EHG8_9PEZI|nr:galactose oxidase [Lepidopterella palustris CBS 459.81]